MTSGTCARPSPRQSSAARRTPDPVHLVSADARWMHAEGQYEEGSMSADRSDVAADLPTTEEAWRARLTPEQYYVLRQKGTERPWSGEYNLTKQDGVYRCAGCGAELFRSDDKFDSHCGWPSFTSPAEQENVVLTSDNSHGMVR